MWSLKDSHIKFQSCFRLHKRHHKPIATDPLQLFQRLEAHRSLAKENATISYILKLITEQQFNSQHWRMYDRKHAKACERKSGTTNKCQTFRWSYSNSSQRRQFQARRMATLRRKCHCMAHAMLLRRRFRLFVTNSSPSSGSDQHRDISAKQLIEFYASFCSRCACTQSRQDLSPELYASQHWKLILEFRD